MKMKLLIPTMSVAFLMPLAASAGDYKSHEKMDEQAIQSLNLSESKTERVQEIMDDYYEGKKELKEKMKDDVAKLEETKEQNLQAVLTEDEMEKLEELAEQNREAREQAREMSSID